MTAGTHRAATRMAATAAVLLALAAFGGRAHACACCSNDGQRLVETGTIDTFAAALLADIRFDAAAHLYTGEGEPDERLPVTSAAFRLSVTKADAVWSFAFAQEGGAGTLTFALPKSVTRFEVDTRGSPSSSGGLGPVLYKEWRLTAPARGDGLLRAATGGDRQATLILHGRGNSCTDASQFNAWTLVLHGSKDTTTIFGTLSPQ